MQGLIKQGKWFGFLALYVAVSWILPIETKTAGIYAVLATSMWFVGIAYGRKAYKSWKDNSGEEMGFLLIVTGIALSFTGHAIDQTLWATGNILSASEIRSGAVVWIMENLKWLIETGKGLAVLGALLHLKAHNSTSRRFELPKLISVAILAWVVFSYAFLLIRHLNA